MVKTRLRTLLAAMPLALVLTLSGCGSDDGSDGDDVASADEGDAEQDDAGPDDAQESGDDDGSGEPMSEDERDNQMLDYAQCLRDHGLEVEDPPPGEGIQIQNEGGPNSSQEALEACEDMAPQPPPGAPDKEEERADMLAFAQCMRDNGVESFEDPKPGEGTHLGPESAEDPDFEKADEKCRELMGGGNDRVERGS